jgi:3-keto-disaccharide hydrolase
MWIPIALFAVLAVPQTGEWKDLFDGKTLANWAATEFGGQGKVRVRDGTIEIDEGATMSGITWSGGAPPKTNYEISLEAMRVSGIDFFCALTFPVAETHCTFVVGGWGGGVVGLSSIDGLDASENETTDAMSFSNNRWYRIRVRVDPDRIQAWIDDKEMVNVSTMGRRISIRSECDLSRPLGIATWMTSAALRNIRLRALP